MKNQTKELFYQKMQPYFDNGIVREVCASEFMSVLSIGEQIYVACPFMLLKTSPYGNSPYGIFMNHSVLKEMVVNERKFFLLIKDIFKNIYEYKQLIFCFSEDNLEKFKSSVSGKISDKNYVDHDFEEELIEINQQKRIEENNEEERIEINKKEKRWTGNILKKVLGFFE